VTDALYKELRKFVASNPMYKTTADQLDRSRPFVERQLRYDLITAAFGSVTALQVLNQEDPQIAQAVDAMPRARELAIAARRARARS
jgi:pyoverdine/dityrosine biosynthesis protein Dit1